MELFFVFEIVQQNINNILPLFLPFLPLLFLLLLFLHTLQGTFVFEIVQQYQQHPTKQPSSSSFSSFFSSSSSSSFLKTYFTRNFFLSLKLFNNPPKILLLHLSLLTLLLF